MARKKQTHTTYPVDLKQLGVIITRPAHQCTQLIDKIETHNGCCFIVPCLEIIYPENIAQAKTVCSQEAQQYDYWLFTSPNSVRFALEFDLKLGSVSVMAIGKGTSDAIKQQTDMQILHAEKPYTSEALMTMLNTMDLQQKKILIISGEGGRRLLGDALNERGAIAHYVDVYRRKRPDFIDIKPALEYASTHNLVILVSSQEAFDYYHEVALTEDPYYLNRSFIVASERLRSYLVNLGYKHIFVAASAAPLDLWHTLCSEKNNLLKIDQTQTLAPAPLLQLEENNGSTKELFMSNKEFELPDSETVDETHDTPDQGIEYQNELPLSATVADPIPQKSSGGKGLAFLALIVGLAGAALAGYNYLNSLKALPVPAIQENTEYYEANKRMQGVIDSLKIQLDELKTQQTALDHQPAAPVFDATSIETRLAELTKVPEALIPELQKTDGKLYTELDEVKTQQQKIYKTLSNQSDQIVTVNDMAKKSQELVHSIQSQLTENLLEQQSTLNNINELASSIKNTTDMNALALAETSYLLKLSNYKLRFEGDIKTSTDALLLALKRLEEVNQPEFTETRNRIQDNVATLQKLNIVSPENVAQDITTIARIIPELSLKQDDALNALKERVFAEEKDKANRATTWYHRVWNKVTPLIFVKQERMNAPELMAFEDSSYLRQNIQLQLSAARLAALQKQPAVYMESLQEVRAWLNKYYSENNDQFHDVIAKIDLLLKINLAPEIPDTQPTFKAFEAAMRVYQGGGL